ncbi:hypothetical protein HQN86_12850 [Pedobacter panaciterrae]|uniref:hypothetical protein n=1 Tax=Pedobacter panaciterrae TaxID=363849 RepID=UPI00155DAC52|nr:hypothetical protein [Pedobacter panaciterrae]NQX54506.1 hypothetical protein [Pedobacter panaciterrae]
MFPWSIAPIRNRSQRDKELQDKERQNPPGISERQLKIAANIIAKTAQTKLR